ncbi:archease [Candidatus Woesearchaeota archaeon]|nr:archease [Candidatus Woesearchaeota archaeon]
MRKMNINNDNKKYKFLEDVAIADIAYEAYGRDLNEVFENAAFAIFELSADLDTVEAKQKVEFELENEKLDNLLYDFLSEILFLKDSKYMVFKNVKVEIKKDEKYKLKSILRGDTINPQKQQLENDIKAVTMHMFEIKKEKSGYKATVVVDI